MNRDGYESAVAAGIISADQAAALRAHLAAPSRASGAEVVAADGTAAGGPGEENFRLLTGFNDIFVTVAALLVLVATGALVGSLFTSGDRDMSEAAIAGIGLSVAGVAWGLSEYFTRRLRMALPSIVLLIAFVGGLFVGTGALMGLALGGFERFENGDGPVFEGVLGGLVAGIGAFLHWRRFRVPITPAAGVFAVGVAAFAYVANALDTAGQDGAIRWLLLLCGLGVFALAMRWDASDPERVTRRSDVAFWLHLLAAPMIAHSIFSGIRDGDAGVGVALLTIGLYAVFALVALAIDRRAILVSSLAYVLWALNELFENAGAVGVNVALAALVIGSALLMLSAFWQPIRAKVLGGVPASWRDRLPPVRTAALSPRPA